MFSKKISLSAIFTHKRVSLLPAIALACITASCGDETPAEENEGEVISQVVLSLTPTVVDGAEVTDGEAVTATWLDADGEGGEAPTVQALNLQPNTTYSATVTFTDTLADPNEDITAEVEEEADEHQVFYLQGNPDDTANLAINTPSSPSTDALLSLTYTETSDAPLGLNTQVVTQAQTGQSSLRLVLRHLPNEGDKVDNLATQIKNNTLTDIPGESDVDIVFAIQVAAP